MVFYGGCVNGEGKEVGCVNGEGNEVGCVNGEGKEVLRGGR